MGTHAHAARAHAAHAHAAHGARANANPVAMGRRRRANANPVAVEMSWQFDLVRLSRWIPSRAQVACSRGSEELRVECVVSSATKQIRVPINAVVGKDCI